MKWITEFPDYPVQTVACGRLRKMLGDQETITFFEVYFVGSFCYIGNLPTPIYPNKYAEMGIEVLEGSAFCFAGLTLEQVAIYKSLLPLMVDRMCGDGDDFNSSLGGMEKLRRSMLRIQVDEDDVDDFVDDVDDFDEEELEMEDRFRQIMNYEESKEYTGCKRRRASGREITMVLEKEFETSREMPDDEMVTEEELDAYIERRTPELKESAVVLDFPHVERKVLVFTGYEIITDSKGGHALAVRTTKYLFQGEEAERLMNPYEEEVIIDI